MNTNKIVNFILLIFICHLILINLNFSKIIEFSNNSINVRNYNENDYNKENYSPPTMSDYIENKDEELNKPRDELYKYINGNDYYSDNNNSSNFKSNVMRVDNFYKSNDNTDVNIQLNTDNNVNNVNDVNDVNNVNDVNDVSNINSLNNDNIQYTDIDDIRMGFNN